MSQINYYGFHTTPQGVVYLHQGRAAANFIGLKQSSPFQTEMLKKTVCPHLITVHASTPDRKHWRDFQRLFNDPLVQALLPLPKEHGTVIPFVVNENHQLDLTLVLLSKMCSPVFQLVKHITTYSKREILRELAITNCAPLVLYGIQPKDQELMYELASEARSLPRRLVFAGESTVVIRTPLVRIQTALTEFEPMFLASLPMESFGALLSRRFARGEQLDGEIIKRGEIAEA